MKVLVYNYRDFDEDPWFKKYSEELGLELEICRETPALGKNTDLSKGCDALSIITTKIPGDMVEEFYRNGVRYISTRTIGYDHIDLKKCKELGIQVGNAVYGPEGVADYTVMLMLMCLRKMKRIMQRAEINDFSLKGIQGRELKDFSVGVIGTGRIGKTVIKNLTGFGCKIYAYDKFQNDEVKEYAEYVDFETLLKNSDIITLHTPLTDENFHLLNKETISKMKDNSVIVNTARGGLIDSQALIEALKNGKLAACGLDVVENEFGMYYNDLKSDMLDNDALMILRSMPNVIVTPHMAFYTDNAIRDMVGNSLKSIKAWRDGSENPWRVL